MINIAGHRLGTREIEESISGYPNVAEVAVVGIKDALKGQVAVAFVIPKQSDTLADREAARDEEKAIMALVDNQIGHLVVRRMSGLFRSSPKRVPERCFAARSRRSVKAEIRAI